MAGLNLGGRLRAWAKSSDTVKRWREERYKLFLDECRVAPDEPILDVGAGEGSALERFNRTNPITAVDLEHESTRWLEGTNVQVMQGDGTALPFENRSFPIAFSNSVIEHVPKALQPEVRGGDPARVGALLRADAEPLVPDRAALPDAVRPVPPGAGAQGAQPPLHDGLPQEGRLVRDDAPVGRPT